MNLTGNTILITGGTSGIGLALAKQLNMLNNKVIICGRRAERLEEIRRVNAGIVTKVCDIADAQQRVDLTEWIFQNYPEINILINNAGVQLHTDFLRTGDLANIRKETEINFIAPIHFIQLFTSYLSRKESAAIINISSGLAFVPLAVAAVYSATKAAIHSLTLSLRYQLRNTTIKVFEIVPPSVDTELGYEHREDKTSTHGGMDVNEFASQVIDALQNDIYEAAIGTTANLRAKPQEMFDVLNRW
ncbi:SDR family NAD(P)-dependent oxidoreductase [Ilyomonas limi]|uniref:SDR family NAD(P)-dependent oxidoreductase n=1 Tax=Ilyomonas limi TaxID=2575867 RepID=A0A4U3L3D7_9BACT|nr:SDR family NAD(P)-dependent oxidoreductase [Ilyomonas limi]TKK68057.1 SDR family NAD(P)-dependent oxidoreductase [Ilyomonas limi]